jgi:hypothetical protein
MRIIHKRASHVLGLGCLINSDVKNVTIAEKSSETNQPELLLYSNSQSQRNMVFIAFTLNTRQR